MSNYLKTHHCGELTIKHLNKSTSLSGWVHRRRDHGGLIFIDLRDHGGITQLVFDPNINKEAHQKAHALRSEWVINVKGTVIARAEGMANSKMATGEIEIEVQALEILSPAQTPPFSISDELVDVKEELRLKYRYLDMRRGPLLRNIHMRHKVTLAVRNFLSEHGFYDVATPILCKSTPEGARDYLVPSRIYPGSFYALPQSPQMFKQLLMIGGLHRYFQICPCFRDEDLRADRQPEFTQIDIETSFDCIEDLFKLIEELFKTLFETCLGKKIHTPFKRMAYQDCIDRYGTDKPDLRIPLFFKRFDAFAKKSSFDVFKVALENGAQIKAMRLPKGAELSRRQIDTYTSFVSQFGAKGLAWFKMQEGALKSNIVKFFDEKLQKEIIEHFEIKENDLLFIIAEKPSILNQSFDHLRRQLAKDLKLIDSSKEAFLWVSDFPLFEYDDAKQLAPAHHPFTAPHSDDLDLLEQDPIKCRSLSYDLVLNGYEIASGSQRIHDPKVQKKIFSLLKLSEDEIKKKFGFFVSALSYGTPPHLGLGLGLDRIMMIFLNTENIRDVIAFPKTQKASDLMMESPSEVDPSQLDELKIDIVSKEFS